MKKLFILLLLFFTPVIAQAHPMPKQCFETIEALRQEIKNQHAYYATYHRKTCWHVHNEIIKTKPELKKQDLKKPTLDDKRRMKGYLHLDCDDWFQVHEDCINWR